MGTTPVVIFSGLGPGLGLSVNPFDPDYEKKMLAAETQQLLDRDNTSDGAAYVLAAHDTLLQNIQLQAAGKPLIQLDPPKHKKVLDANGNIATSAEFVAVPVSVIPPPPPTTQQSGAPSPTLQSQAPVADRTDQIMSMLQYIEGQILQLLKTKAGA